MNQYYRPAGFGGFSFFPPVIKNLLIANAVIFFVQIVGEQILTGTGYTFAQIITKYFALIPVDGFIAGSMGGEPIIWNFYPWQLVSYQFLHGGFGHIFWNMFALWMFGMEIENLWGSKKFLYFYLLSGIGAGLCHLFLSPLMGGGNAPTIGASGSIFGVLIAFAMIFPNRYIFLYFFIPVKAKYLVTFFILLQLFLVGDLSSNIAYLAHLGGALTGFIFIMLDKNTHVILKDIFSRSSFRTSKPFNPFGGVSDRFKRKEENIQDANYYEVKKEDEVTQEEIDRILDKISQSGYKNLTDREKRILFEASKKMK
jgi:membrane associated rhomboid family serine protease